jgi:hypothetical protein
VAVAFNGLIQHSFALQLAKGRRPFAGPDTKGRVQERFALPGNDCAAFGVRAVCEPAIPGDPEEGKCRVADPAEHSPLVRAGQTTVEPLPVSFSGADGRRSGPVLPPAFKWAGRKTWPPDPRQEGPAFAFGEVDPETGKVECNDYLVEQSGCEAGAQSITLSLLEILAHKRSRLLGLALANRVVSVMLPHAVLSPVKEEGEGLCGPIGEKPWFVQPLVSFVRDGKARAEFRDSYALTLLLVPITAAGYGERKMTGEEIDLIVNAGWSLAAFPSREKPPRFQVKGPLPRYLRGLAAPFDPRAGGCGGRLALREGTEMLAFGVGLRLAQGSAGRATRRTMCRIGDDVVTSLGSARVSSVLVVDKLSGKEIRQGRAGRPLGRHRALMERLSRETRPPTDWTAEHRKYRLDRPFVDGETYVVGVVPAKRCLVVSCAAEAQHGWYQSGLMQAGSLTHMTIGAATAIGTLRAIDRDLEGLEAGDPSKIADIDGEIATDLREIYDLDITGEEYRSLYRLLRKRLGITRDYEALQDKMATLYRSTSTRHEVRSQRQIAQLTAAIVVLSVLILVFTIAVAFE